MNWRNFLRKTCLALFTTVCFAIAAYAQSGYSGDLEWKVVRNTLIISGKGEMKDAYTPPWWEYSKSITTVIIESGATNIARRAFEDFKNLTSITIPNTVKIIGYKAFRGTNIKTLDIPRSVAKIDSYAFYCDNLVSINVDKDNSAFTSENGVLFNKIKTILIRYPSAKTNEAYIIPNTVLTIEDGAFAFSKNLKTVTIPESVKHIGSRAFDEAMLTNVICYATDPPSAENWRTIFDKRIGRLSVPAASKNKYKESSDWGQCFDGITAIE
jgi:hypothetical protein